MTNSEEIQEARVLPPVLEDIMKNYYYLMNDMTKVETLKRNNPNTTRMNHPLQTGKTTLV